MKYRLINIESVGPDRSSAVGVLECLDTSDLATGPFRVPVARYSGPLLPNGDDPGDFATSDWRPAHRQDERPDLWAGPPGPDYFVRLKWLVGESGLTLTDTAGRAEMSPGNLHRLINGRTPNASLIVVDRVLRAIGCTLADLSSI